jgi:hypothetical protein
MHIFCLNVIEPKLNMTDSLGSDSTKSHGRIRLRLLPTLAGFLRFTLIAAGLCCAIGFAYIFLHDGKELGKSGPINIIATPLHLNANNPSQNSIGHLKMMGAWEVSSEHPGFGGISSLLVEDGRILALNDTGQLIGFTIPTAGSRQFIAPLPLRKHDKMAKKQWDSESMLHDPVTDRYWVGFELIHRICRYSSRFGRVESCMDWPAMERWKSMEGVEAMAHLPDNRFLAFSEGTSSPMGGKEVLLFHGDPADASTPQPQKLSYIPPQGYRPTDALWIGGNALLVLNRRVTMLDGFTGVLSLVDISQIGRLRTLQGREVARFTPPILADNFEALALEQQSGKRFLWIASDDNHEFFQRTLLLRFQLPDSFPL